MAQGAMRARWTEQVVRELAWAHTSSFDASSERRAELSSPTCHVEWGAHLPRGRGRPSATWKGAVVI